MAMQWGSFGEQVFKTTYSPTTINDTRKWRLVKHALINGYPGHEYQGEDQRVITMQLQLHRTFTPCQSAYDEFITMADSGAAHTLAIGDHVLGDFAIQGITRVINSTTSTGEQIMVTLSLNLLEVRN
jgi:phage protein U